MYKITWDKETGGVLLRSRIVEGTLGTSPRPVFWEELDLLKLNELGWKYPHSEEPLLWAINKKYRYRGELVFKAKGANVYDEATVFFQPGKEALKLKPVNVKKMREEQKKNVKASGGSPMMMVNEFFRLFGDAIENTEAATYEEFLARLAKEANVFLAHLNVDDFTGVIKIYLDRYNDLKIELQDKNGKLITNPNTSLLTTMHISILFAISELTKENRDAEYPLIFDAPTSSFDEGKDKTFYECLNTQVNKQCIVVTKSYLYKNDNGEYVTDTKALSKLNCQKYRIKKLTGFDKLDITTIDTVVEEIKEA